MPDNSPKALRKSIVDLEKRFHQLLREAPWQKHQTSNGPKYTAKDEGNSASGETLPETQIPPSPSNSNDPQKPWYKTHAGWKVLLEVIAIPFAIGYAIVTYLQWRDLRSNFVIDQRAWVGVISSATSGAVQSPDAQSFSFQNVQVVLRNTGKTPALNVSITTGQLTRELKDAAPTIDDMLGELERRRAEFREKLRRDMEDAIRKSPQLAEGIKHTASAMLAHTDTRLVAEGAALSPGADRVIQFGPGTVPVFNSDQKTGTLYLIGKISYADIFSGGQTHTTRFCFMRLLASYATEFVPCPTGNTMN